jgi:hypothetical protein
LTRLSDSVTLLLETLLLVELHRIFGLLEVARVKEETADESAGATLSVVAVDDADVADVLQKVFHNDFADDEQRLKLRCFVILPIERVNVGQFVAVDFPPTHVDDLVTLFVVLLQKL